MSIGASRATYDMENSDRLPIKNGAASTGKRVGKDVYVHMSAIGLLPPHLALSVEQAVQCMGVTPGHFNVVRISDDGRSVSLLDYPRFLDDPFPRLRKSCHIVLSEPTVVSRRNYSDSINPPVLHRKELLLAPDDPRRREFAETTCAAEAIGLFDNPTRIGFAADWEALIEEKGYRLDGVHFVALGNIIDRDNTSVASDSTRPARHLTALARYGFSAPVHALARFGFFSKDWTFFDYGCGRGDDIRGLQANGVQAAGWDPYYAPAEERKAADIVNLGFVLNVIEDRAERDAALRSAFALTRRLLAVSVMLVNGTAPNGRPYGDGFMTQRGTFQRYYTQMEFKVYLKETLGHAVILVAPGVAFVFAEAGEKQRFLFNRQRSTRALFHTQPRLVRPACGPSSRVQRDLYAENEAEFETLWQRTLVLGRVPAEEEAREFKPLFAQIGSVNKAFRIMLARQDPLALEAAAQRRANDLRVYFGLQHFHKRTRYSGLEAGIQRDVNTFFGSLSQCKQEGLALLRQIADVEAIEEACSTASDGGLGYYVQGKSLQLHTTLVARLAPLLRAYVGAASTLYGDIGSADLVKIHTRSGKLTLLEFNDFDSTPAPCLKRRVKIKLRAQDFDMFDYGAAYEPTVLLKKSRYLNEEYPRYAEQLAFDQAIDDLKLFHDSNHAPTLREFSDALKRARWELQDFRLIRATSIPDLDEPCGRYLRFRDLIECSDTQRTQRITNRPQQARSYNALHELTSHILDPIIGYYGMIRLTYGFCSAELAKVISRGITPGLDQHSSHELNRRGSPICPRLGAAADFLVEDEDMFEVARWIAQHLPFDRLYVYNPERPIHVSYGPANSREIVHVERYGTRVRPRVIRDPIQLGR